MTYDNEYVVALEERAPALFWGKSAVYSGTYIAPDRFAAWDGSPVRETEAAVEYVVTNERAAGNTQASITVPMVDVAEFEKALQARIRNRP